MFPNLPERSGLSILLPGLWVFESALIRLDILSASSRTTDAVDQRIIAILFFIVGLLLLKKNGEMLRGLLLLAFPRVKDVLVVLLVLLLVENIIVELVARPLVFRRHESPEVG